MEDELYYQEITPSGFSISIKVKKVLFSEESEYQKIEVLETETLGKILTLDDLMIATENDEYYYHEIITHIPMINHPCPKNILVMGGGDGGTVREVLKHKCVESVIHCEIDEKVIEVAKKYMPITASELENPKVKLVIEDGMKYIQNKKNMFDVILIDSIDPMGLGFGFYSEEFFENIRDSLKKDGIMVIQVESPIAEEDESKKIYKMLKNTFNIVDSYTSPIPTYPSGCWAWAFCSQTIEPLSYIDEKRCEDISKQCKIYNKNYHLTRFDVPTFLDEIK